jgi:hypothetical protein
MLLRRVSAGMWLILLGSLVMFLGVLLLLVKLVIRFSELAEIVLLAGLGLFLLGVALRRLRGGRRLDQDLPYY